MDFDQIFDWCVALLINWANALGMTYNEINIWIFVILEPIVFLVMVFVIIWQYRKIKKLKNEGQSSQANHSKKP